MFDEKGTDFAEREFHTGELSINYAEAPASGPPLVLLHGSTGDWRGYRDLMIRLSPRWHAFACDLRGHGKSGRQGNRYRLVDYVRDILAFVDRLDKPPVVLGRSLGALTALGVAAQAPTSVRGLILLDPPLFVRNSRQDLHSEMTERFAWASQTMRRGPTFRELIKACRRRGSRESEAEAVEPAEGLMRVAPETLDVILCGRLLQGVDLDEVARRVRQPTLLIRGDWAAGGLMREEDEEWFRARVPQTNVVRIPGGSHLFLWEQAEATCEAIEAFLDSLE